MSSPNNLYQNELEDYGKYRLRAGVDEAGRGPLAGPLVVAAVILTDEIDLVNDSKKLTTKLRNRLYEEIMRQARAVRIKVISAQVIDKLNILQATLFGMNEVLSALPILPDICLIDGNRLPRECPYPATGVIQGDGRYASIAAASIVAKVVRDRIMEIVHHRYPLYNFASNKGYATQAHRDAIIRHGICPYHRRSYKPVSQIYLDFSDISR